MASAKSNSTKRRERAEQMRQAEAARDRRNRIIAIVASVVVVGGMVGGGWAIIASASDDGSGSSKSAAPAAKVQGEKTFGGLTQGHVSGAVDYKQTPPVGGDHDPQWQNCNGDVYAKPLRNENAVHALEHGSVWITYNAKASDDDITTLTSKVKGKPYTLMSPYPSQSGTVTLTAWGHQLIVPNAKDPRVDEFLKDYVNGDQTPEKGAVCTGGKSQP